ncbi:MAG: hypothetical protein WD972_02440 [Candidatus Andersenbacteria bacterium]
MNSPQTKVIIILIGVLLAAVGVSVLVVWILPAGEETELTVPEVGVDSEEVSLTPPTTGFNLKVLQTAGYVALDKQPIVEKALPVQPPATTGKANPFL